MILFPLGLWLAVLVCGRGTMLSQIFGGMKDEGHSGSVRGRDQTDKITISGLAVIISTSPGLASVLGFIVVVTTTPHHTTPHHTTPPPMLHSQTIKCWIFCIPQDHWSCQSLLYMRACVQLVVCELYTCKVGVQQWPVKTFLF